MCLSHGNPACRARRDRTSNVERRTSCVERPAPNERTRFLLNRDGSERARRGRANRRTNRRVGTVTPGFSPGLRADPNPPSRASRLRFRSAQATPGRQPGEAHGGPFRSLKESCVTQCRPEGQFAFWIFDCFWIPDRVRDDPSSLVRTPSPYESGCSLARGRLTARGTPDSGPRTPKKPPRCLASTLPPSSAPCEAAPGFPG